MVQIMMLALVVILALAYTTNALTLLPCEDYKCEETPNCRGRGIYRTEVTGGCCRACYKLVGEECGGIHDHSGVCRKGLECVSNETDPINKPQGICKRKAVTERLPRKWENLLKSGTVTTKLRAELSKLFKKIRELNTLV